MSTVVVKVFDPPAPVATNVYVVRDVGETVLSPLGPLTFLPSSFQLVALLVFHRNFVDSPRSIRESSAQKVPVGGSVVSGGVGVSSGSGVAVASGVGVAVASGAGVGVGSVTSTSTLSVCDPAGLWPVIV